MKYKKSEINILIYYAKNTVLKELDNLINEGKSNNEINHFMDSKIDDIYTSHKIGDYFTKDKKMYYTLEIFSHSEFIFNCCKLMYSEMYPYDLPLESDENVNDYYTKYSFDSMIMINMTKNFKTRESKEFVMTNDTIIKLADILLYI